MHRARRRTSRYAIQTANRVRCAFTLIEMVATIVVLGVLGSIASRTVFTAITNYTRAATQAQLHSELSIAMDRIQREIRKIPIKESYGSIAPNISSVSSSSIAWNSNYTLSLSGSQVRFVENGAASAVLLDNVTAFTVQTYNESNAALAANLSGTDCDPIRRVAIRITIQRDGVTESLGAKMFIRGAMRGAPTT